MKLTTLLAIAALSGLSAFAATNTRSNWQTIVDVADTAAWKGATLDHELLRDGKPTMQWSHGVSTQLSFPTAPKDWTSHSHVHFWVHSRQATKAGIVLILDADVPDTPGMDYYMARLTIDFSGWKEVLLPINQISRVREARGKDQLRNVYFTAAGWENTPNPDTVLNFGSISFVDVVPQMLSLEEFFTALDWSTPGLADAAAAWEKRDLPAAVQATAKYFRERRSVPWRFDPHDPNYKPSFNRGAAEDTVAGKVSVVTVRHQFPDGDIDWLYNHTIAVKELPNNNEWLWQLNRMGFWGNLGRAYRSTGDSRYARTFVKHLRRWTSQCIAPTYSSGNVPNSAWRTIECGIRLQGSWPEAYHLFLHAPEFTDDDLVLFLRSGLEQMRHLLKYPQRGNWLTMEMNGVYTFASLFPEFSEAAAARQFAVERLHEDMKTQFLADGAQFELTPGYHQVALGNILSLPRLAKLMGREQELPGDFVPTMEKAYDYNLRLMTPNRDLPRYNDSWRCNVVSSLRGALDFFPEREDFRWIATDGKEGEKPSELSTFLPWAGYFALRSSWQNDANYVGFDVGPLGYGHMHQDKLNVIIWAGADELLFDDGGGCYESSAFRRYATSAFGHNTVLVDGLPQVRNQRELGNRVVSEPIDAPRTFSDLYDFAAGSYDQGFGKIEHEPARHSRQVLFIKPDIVLVCDLLEAKDGQSHRYQARWQVNDTTLREPIAGHPALITQRMGKRNLLVAPLLSEGLSSRWVSAQTEPEVLGWYVIKDAGPYRPAATVCHEREGDGLQIMLTLFMPLAADTPCPVSAISQESLRQATVTFNDGRRLVVTAPPSADERMIFAIINPEQQ
ncbi:MAG: heparinase II/III family protein [Lentisphaeria bacterium]|jgi:hypothetical protein